MTVHPSVGVSPRKGRSGARLTALSLFFFLFNPFPGFQRRDPSLHRRRVGFPVCVSELCSLRAPWALRVEHRAPVVHEWRLQPQEA